MIWQFKPKPPDEFIKQFPEFSPEILQLLYNRGLRTQEQIDEFFNPDFEGDLHDPFLMMGVAESVKRIAKAIKNQELIAIFGDYDADGICGSVILETTLKALGANFELVHIPDRQLEGYGLNESAINRIAKKGVKLIITVDCGITDFAEIALAKSLKIEVIITDHHQPLKKLPQTKFIINPFQAKDRYPFKELAGAGVAFKLAGALVQELGDAEFQKKHGTPVAWSKWLLDLVALATVADCMPLLGENRTLVRYGLIVLAQTRRVGLQELMKLARLNPVFEVQSLKTNLDTYSLGFVLAPRLNAAGRVDHASLAFELLTVADRAQARILAQKINEQNQLRQKITNDIVGEIEKRLQANSFSEESPVIVEADKAWSSGVIGLVAGKIADRYHRPTFIFREESGRSRGSARSIPAFNLVEAIGQCTDLLKEYGGHPGAAGLAIENKNLLSFKEKINKIARDILKPEDLKPFLEVDIKLEPQAINWSLLDSLTRFEPFGNSNEQPIFLSENFEIVNLRVVGNGSKHLKLELKNAVLPGKIFHAIGFNLAGVNSELKKGDKINLVFELIADEWNGTRSLQLKIIDLKKI